jgi:hypothetical protein
MLNVKLIIFDGLAKSQKSYFLSFRRKSLDRLGTLSPSTLLRTLRFSKGLSNGPESRDTKDFWTPAFAGATT